MMNAMEKMNSKSPIIATQGVLMCVVSGEHTKEESEAILRLSKSDNADCRVAGRATRDWIVAAMDVLKIKRCAEPDGSDAYDLIQTLTDPEWLNGMRDIVFK